jgi:hypothetical protein
MKKHQKTCQDRIEASEFIIQLVTSDLNKYNEKIDILNKLLEDKKQSMHPVRTCHLFGWSLITRQIYWLISRMRQI